MTYRYFLDGNLITEPQGWDKFITSINRDKSNNGITIAQDFTLTFGATEFDYFKNKIDSDGYCAESTILIEYSQDYGNSWFEFHNGIIYISDIAFDEKRKECTTKVQDNSFYAYINNNISVGAFPFAGKSKNGIDITIPTQQYLQCFVVDDNTPFPVNTASGYEYHCYLVYDILKYLIAFMTDNKVQFKSDTFDVGGIYHDYIITTGYVLRYSIQDGFLGADNPQGINRQQFESSWQQISFKDFYDEMYKRFNLIWWIENIAGVPTFRIEADSDSRITSISNISNHYIDELKSEVESDLLYSNLKIGAGAFEEQSQFTLFPSRVNLFGFRDEEMLVSGQCNLDSTLDLQSSYIQDTNIIQNCLEQGWATIFTTDYDNEFFIINAIDDLHGNCIAVGSNWLQTTPPYYYNEQLNNYNIIERFFNGIPNSLAQYLRDGDNTAKAYQLPMGSYTPNIFNQPVVFTDTTPPNGYDPNANFNTTTYRYTAPYEGAYTFRIQIGSIFTAVNPSDATAVQWGLAIYDSLGNLQYTRTAFTSFTIGGLYRDVVVNFPATYMGFGWYTEVAILEYSTGDATDPSDYIFFECINAANDGLINYVDQTKIPITKYSFKIPMNLDELVLIKNNLPSLIPFRRYDESTKYGWVKSLRYNHKENIADIILITSKDIINGN